jgi:hypothetical protein
MKNRLSNVVLVMSLLLVVGCEHEDEPGFPVCLWAKIQQPEQGEGLPIESISRVKTSDDKTFFRIGFICCDIPSIMVDSQCNTICQTEGGWTPSTCTGYEIIESVIVWELKR